MDATQIILIVFIVLLIIIYPIMISARNKKETQRMQEQTNSLKRGDKILTTSGVYGTIVDLHLEDDKKIVTIETGMGNNKGYLSVDAYAIYTVFKDETNQVGKENIDLKKDEDKKQDNKIADKEINNEKSKEQSNNEQTAMDSTITEESQKKDK